jgi:L-lactate permease
VLFFSGIGLKSVTASIVVALIFVIPTLFISMGTYLVDNASMDRKFPLIMSMTGVSFLPMAYLILRSFDDTESDLVGLLVLISIGILALSWYKAVEIRTFLNSADSENSIETIQDRDVLRIISPTTIIAIYLVLLSIFFIWSENFALSLIASIFWCAPLYISIIKFESNLFSNFRNWYRSTLIEISLVIAMIYGIYYLLDFLPLLVQDRSKLMLSILALPVVIHALYVASVESGKLISKADL